MFIMGSTTPTSSSASTFLGLLSRYLQSIFPKMLLVYLGVYLDSWLPVFIITNEVIFSVLIGTLFLTPLHVSLQFTVSVLFHCFILPHFVAALQFIFNQLSVCFQFFVRPNTVAMSTVICTSLPIWGDGLMWMYKQLCRIHSQKYTCSLL